MAQVSDVKENRFERAGCRTSMHSAILEINAALNSFLNIWLHQQGISHLRRCFNEETEYQKVRDTLMQQLHTTEHVVNLLYTARQSIEIAYEKFTGHALYEKPKFLHKDCETCRNWDDGCMKGLSPDHDKFCQGYKKTVSP
jgi:hypothetical protein